MRETIYTIPINEIFEEKCGCPICSLYRKIEQRLTEYTVGPAMMEPDIRQETNKKGFCERHFRMLLKQQKRLPLALILESHLDTISKDCFEQNFFNKIAGNKKPYKKVEQATQTCYICEKMEQTIDGMIDNLFRHYQTDRGFRELFAQQEVFCLPHYKMLCNLAQQKLDKNKAADFIKTASEITENYLKNLSSDVSEFCKMFDYRSAEMETDTEKVKDSIERAIWFLTSESME